MAGLVYFKDRYNNATYADHKIWQDVYHGCTLAGREIYLKLTVIDPMRGKPRRSRRGQERGRRSRPFY